ncbi:MAG: glutamate-cysteine ligase family protein [Actinomycetota bacterium]|nr:glutamate-cysteine ligase family protein [Actinomycetota bacterium]
MEADERPLTPADIDDVVDRCFAAGDDRVGVEVEWLLHPVGAPDRRPRLSEIERAVEGSLDAGGSITIEPGGQVELSTSPHATARLALEALRTDTARLHERLAAHGIEPVAIGADPVRRPGRLVDAPRYRAMEASFDHGGPEGRRMMCNTASIQLNVGHGPEPRRRWRLANAIGPTVAACFANAPIAEGLPSGHRSVRQAAWLAIDPSRTRQPQLTADPRDGWRDFALDANVLLIRRPDRDAVTVAPPFPFRRWLEEGHAVGAPTGADFRYHLTTLFPPVRARGWLELRMIDAVPEPARDVVVAAVTALLVDDDAGAEALEAVAGVEDAWDAAARCGPTDPRLATAGVRCLSAAAAALRRGGDGALADAVDEFADRYPAEGRCPADDVLAEWAAAPPRPAARSRPAAPPRPDGQAPPPQTRPIPRSHA